MSTFHVDTDAIVPLELTVVAPSTGGVTGLTPTVAVRDGATLNKYLDWSDDTFKTSGWTTKYATMDEVERGHYRKLLTLPLITPVPAVGDKYSAEFHAVNAGIIGDDHDTILISEIGSGNNLSNFDYFFIKRNDRNPSLKATLKSEDGLPINLTGVSAVRIFMVYHDTAIVKINGGSCIVTDAVNGKVEYEWQTADTDDAGTFDAEFEVTFADSTRMTIPNNEYFVVKILPDLGQ